VYHVLQVTHDLMKLVTYDGAQQQARNFVDIVRELINQTPQQMFLNLDMKRVKMNDQQQSQVDIRDYELSSYIVSKLDS
ncbi:unnamed protein product, partial [Didymodactylos carnosus]